MPANSSAEVVVFGNVVLGRVFCGFCNYTALVLKDQTMACCGASVSEEVKFTRVKRIVEPENSRKHVPVAVKQAKLLEQDNRCLYCDRQFGSHVLRKARWIELKVRWDHMVPFSYQQNNRSDNLAAACQICNARKYNIMFQTLEEARIYLQPEVEDDVDGPF